MTRTFSTIALTAVLGLSALTPALASSSVLQTSVANGLKQYAVTVDVSELSNSQLTAIYTELNEDQSFGETKLRIHNILDR
ncbi:MAG: hypothetical protein ACPGNV_12310 [Mangrovicoccus sp.]